VSGSYFATLGVNALLGRVLTPADDELAGGPDGTAAVLSYTAWKRRFNGDAGAVGMHVLLDRAPVTIVGVLPPFFLGNRSRSNVRFLPAGTPRVRRTVDHAVRSVLNLVEHHRPAEAGSDRGVVGCGASRSAAGASIDDSGRDEPPAEYLKEPLTLVLASGGTSGGT